MIGEEPKFSVSEVTTYHLSFQEDLAVYREAGAGGIGIWEFKLPEGRDRESLDQLRDSGLQATLCAPAVVEVIPSEFGGPTDVEERVEAMCAGIRRLAPFNPVAIACLPGPRGQLELNEALRIAADGLRKAAQTAAEFGIQIAVEPLHPEVLGDKTIITSLAQTIELIDRIDQSNIGILFDLYHHWDQPDILSQIREHVGRFGGAIHIDDWREPTRSWADRALPGEGAMDLPALLGALEAAGFDGWYDLEIFSDDGTFGADYPDSLWKLDPLEMLRRAKGGFLRAWQARKKLGSVLPTRENMQ